MARFVNTPEQDELARAARGFVERRLPVAHLRGLRDADGGELARVDRARWREMAQLGWAGLLVPDELGGAGLGLVEAGLVMEELGRTLAPTPMLATGVIGATAIAAASPDLARALAPRLCAGDALYALAFEEAPRFAPARCATTARRTDAGFALDGEKVFVLDGAVADHLIVSARQGDAIDLYVVDRGAPGVEVTPLALVDSRSAARVRFTATPVAADRLVPGGDAVLDHLLARATAALAAEMLGGAEAVFATTLDYLKTRRQFGVAIGSFQALKHRAAHLFCELELTRSVVRAALAAQDAGAGAPDAALLVSAAKARASDTFVQVAAEAIQMHGGIGATDDLDVGLYYKRARAAELTFGDAAHHRDRFARLQGY